ncbi:MobC family plasmid mobilization relaxosome protein [Photobacterium indicum]|uniref:MobC family plasmid mobilization relaxosome protein n=1 Tax=Photobacterium indicum TaxID=81447 RepID=UPI003D098C47
MRLRTKEIKIRVSEVEYQRLLERKTTPRLAEWMRIICLDERKQRVGIVTSCDPVLLRQLSGIGNNLNQIARATNSEDWRTIDRVQVVSALRSLEEELKALRILYS